MMSRIRYEHTKPLDTLRSSIEKHLPCRPNHYQQMFASPASAAGIVAQVYSPTINFSTAVVLLLGVAALWLLLKVFIRIILLAISLGISALAALILHPVMTPFVEKLYLKIIPVQAVAPPDTNLVSSLGKVPDPRLVAFALVFLVTFLLTAFLLGAIFRKSA